MQLHYVIKKRLLQSAQIRKGIDIDDKQTGLVSLEDIQSVEKEIIKSVQEGYFKDEIKALKKKQRLKASSCIIRLDPFMDSKGLLRVGGRICKTALEKNIQHPILIPRYCRATQLIIEWCHNQIAHAGRGMTINAVRASGYWVINCNAAVRSTISKCVRCKILRRKFQQQKMADLPKDRISEEPPFSYCGIDMFVPFTVKDGRKEKKRYGALFTCLSSRAVHIEVSHSMSTDPFIMCLRRFIGRRGYVRVIRTDNGTNFVGASAELIESFQEMDHVKIGEYSQQHGGEWIWWKRNSPLASNMGGVWERQIRTARNILNSLLKRHGASLTDESLQTLLTEVEAIVNSRPLTTDVINDVTSPVPLSSINLLTMKSRVVMPPPGVFTSADMYSRKHWRWMQHLSNEFWSRWRKEVLLTLQNRQKWNNKTRNCEIGDIVLVKDDMERNRWPMAKVVATYKEYKGVVRSVRLLMGSVDRVSQKSRYLERPVNKFVALVENKDEVDDGLIPRREAGT